MAANRDARGEDAPIRVHKPGSVRWERILIERYRGALAEAGIRVSYLDPTKRVPRKRRPIVVEGKPVSEQIIEALR